MTELDDLDDLAGELFAAVPELREAMTEAGADPVPDPDAPTLWLGEVGTALAGRAERLAPGRFAEALAVVERHLAGSDQRMRDAICTGFLEALASAVSGHRLRPSLLADHLGPQSRAYVDAWDQHTLARSSLDPS